MTVVDLGGGGARVGSGQKYQFHVRVGRRALILKFYDEDVEWNEVDGAVIEFGSDVAAGDAVAGLRPTVRRFELIGPLELRVSSDVGDDDRMSLHLTSVSYLLLFADSNSYKFHSCLMRSGFNGLLCL